MTAVVKWRQDIRYFIRDETGEAGNASLFKTAKTAVENYLRDFSSATGLSINEGDAANANVLIVLSSDLNSSDLRIESVFRSLLVTAFGTEADSEKYVELHRHAVETDNPRCYGTPAFDADGIIGGIINIQIDQDIEQCSLISISNLLGIANSGTYSGAYTVNAERLRDIVFGAATELYSPDIQHGMKTSELLQFMKEKCK